MGLDYLNETFFHNLFTNEIFVAVSLRNGLFVNTICFVYDKQTISYWQKLLSIKQLIRYLLKLQDLGKYDNNKSLFFFEPQ